MFPRNIILSLQTVIILAGNCVCSALHVEQNSDNKESIPTFLNIENVKEQLFLNHNLSRFVNSFEHDSDESVLNHNQTKDQRNYNDMKCLNNIDQIQKNIGEFEKWAIQMFDSWGKLPSGILSGNNFEFGDFAQCFSVAAAQKQSERKIQPQYCIAQLIVDLNGVDAKETEENQSNNKQRKGDQLGVPEQFAALSDSAGLSINFGICIPDSCSPPLIETMLTEIVKTKISNASVHISKDLCQFEENYTKLETLDIMAIALCVTTFCLVTASTIYDVKTTVNKKQKIPAFLIFSVYTNGEKLFSCKQIKSADVMHCLHGIRAISTAWIVYAHTSLMYLKMPVRNRSIFLKLITEYHLMLTASATIAVDTFLVIGGILVSMTLLKLLEKTKCKLNLPLIYFHRFLRLTPLLAVTILFSSSLLKFFGNGPLWPLSFEFYREKCEQNWWATLLYIQNYVNVEKMCIQHTWYLAVDMQLFILAPFIVYLIYRYKMKFIFVLGVLILFCIGGTIATYLMYYGNNETGRYQKMSLTYYPTHLRFSPWLIGLIFGYILFNIRNKKVHLSKSLNGFAWVVSSVLMLVVIFGNYPLMQPDRNSLPIEFGLYDSLSRVAWSLAICYIIFACVHNYGGPVNWFLSLRQWQPISRLSYAIYLLHPNVILFMMTTVKSSFYFNETILLHTFVGNYGFTLFAALIASLAFEAPVIVIERLLLNKEDSKPALQTEK